MKTRALIAALALLAALAATGRADEFSDLAHSPNAYWVPTSAGYGYAATPGYYAGPPPVYYYPPPPPAPPPPPIIGGLFFHFHFH